MARFLPLTRAAAGNWRFLICAAVVVLLMGGCSDPLQTENERLRSEIIAVHDEAMAKIGHMYLLETRLKKLQPAADLDVSAIATAIGALQEADREMFSWMNQYQTLFVADDLSLDNRYRREQLEMISTVSRMTAEAIAAAEELLEAD